MGNIQFKLGNLPGFSTPFLVGISNRVIVNDKISSAPLIVKF